MIQIIVNGRPVPTQINVIEYMLKACDHCKAHNIDLEEYLRAQDPDIVRGVLDHLLKIMKEALNNL